MTSTRYIVTMEVDVEGVTDERKVKHQIAYALGMAIADREFYDLSIIRAVHIHANIKPHKKKKQK